MCFVGGLCCVCFVGGVIWCVFCRGGYVVCVL